MAFYKSTFIFILSKPRTKIDIWAGARLIDQKTSDIEIWVLLLLIKAFKVFSVSLFLLLKKNPWQKL